MLRSRLIARRLGYPRRIKHVLPPDENLQARRPLYVMAVFLAGLSALLRLPLLFVAALLVLALAFLPELWYRFGLRALVVRREPETSRVMFGDTVEVPLVVENRKPLPLPWVEIEDEFPDQLPVLGMRLLPSIKPERAVLVNSASLWSYERLRRRYRVRAVERGAFRLGPMTVRTSDPFGMLTREEKRGVPAHLLVLPLVVPITKFGLTARAPFGEQTSQRRQLEDPLRIAGVRDYAPGDEPRRIHWKATARTAELQSKLYDPSSRHTIMLFLDVQTFTRSLMGYAPALLELAVCAASSVASWALERDYAVGLFSNGTLSTLGRETSAGDGTASSVPVAPMDAEDLARQIARSAMALRLRVAPSARNEQLGTILEGLARLIPYYGLSMAQVLSNERLSLPQGATVVYVGSEQAMDVELIVALREVQAHGHPLSILLTSLDEAERTGEHDAHLADLPVHYLGGERRWHELANEALGGLPARRASPLGDPAVLQEEREALRQAQRPPSTTDSPTKSEMSDETAERSSSRWLERSRVSEWGIE
ncbi:MAG TPA: DUF58 domain-containing protein [Ktedonobacterales bacterium]